MDTIVIFLFRIQVGNKISLEDYYLASYTKLGLVTKVFGHAVFRNDDLDDGWMSSYQHDDACQPSIVSRLRQIKQGGRGGHDRMS